MLGKPVIVVLDGRPSLRAPDRWRAMFRLAEAVDYHDGEQPPG
jgi:hypothetical protein